MMELSFRVILMLFTMDNAGCAEDNLAHYESNNRCFLIEGCYNR